MGLSACEVYVVYGFSWVKRWMEGRIRIAKKDFKEDKNRIYVMSRKS